MTYSENRKLFNWSGAPGVLEIGEGDVRLEVKDGTKVHEDQRGTNIGLSLRGAT